MMSRKNYLLIMIINEPKTFIFEQVRKYSIMYINPRWKECIKLHKTAKAL